MRGWFVGMTRQPYLYRTTTTKRPPQKAIITYLLKIENKPLYLLCIAIKYQNSVIYHFDYKLA